MSAAIDVAQSRRFKIGWIVLLVSAALMTLNHSVLFFALNEPTLFAGWAAFNLYALLVISIPFRRQERWAWLATWVLPIGLAAGGLSVPAIGIYYIAVAAVCVVGLLLTMQDFFAMDR